MRGDAKDIHQHMYEEKPLKIYCTVAKILASTNKLIIILWSIKGRYSNSILFYLNKL